MELDEAMPEDLNISKILDQKGLLCPLPIINTAKEKAEQHRQEAIKEVEGLIQDIEKLKKQKSSLMENIKSTAKDHLDKYKEEIPNIRSGNAD